METSMRGTAVIPADIVYIHCCFFCFAQALKMKYFSNRPGPTPGPQLPRPNCSAEALREKETVGLKRKIEGLETSKDRFMTSFYIYSLKFIFNPLKTTLSQIYRYLCNKQRSSVHIFDIYLFCWCEQHVWV